MPLEDHVYMKLCAALASCLSISLASARRQVELVAVRDGVKDLNQRKLIAQRLLDEARTRKNSSKEASSSAQLDQLLEALAEEENFMVED